jgi:hypothetical protein
MDTRNKRRRRCSGGCQAAASVARRVNAGYQAGVTAVFDAITSTLLERCVSAEEAKELLDAVTAHLAQQPSGLASADRRRMACLLTGRRSQAG